MEQTQTLRLVETTSNASETGKVEERIRFFCKLFAPELWDSQKDRNYREDFAESIRLICQQNPNVRPDLLFAEAVLRSELGRWIRGDHYPEYKVRKGFLYRDPFDCRSAS